MSQLGLNVGSGQRPFTTNYDVHWINVDKIAHEGMTPPDLIADGAHLPFSEQSADYVVLHHVAEHFHCGEAGGLIAEAYRVLKFGGVLVVTVPNLRELAMGWLTERISTQIYVTNLYGAYMGHPEDEHRWGFDRDSLKEFLTASASWDSVSDFNFRRIPGADIAQDWWILGVECHK
jgi:predicted SAM-dependent methyltransferase